MTKQSLNDVIILQINAILDELKLAGTDRDGVFDLTFAKLQDISGTRDFNFTGLGRTKGIKKMCETIYPGSTDINTKGAWALLNETDRMRKICDFAVSRVIDELAARSGEDPDQWLLMRQTEIDTSKQIANPFAIKLDQAASNYLRAIDDLNDDIDEIKEDITKTIYEGHKLAVPDATQYLKFIAGYPAREKRIDDLKQVYLQTYSKFSSFALRYELNATNAGRMNDPRWVADYKRMLRDSVANRAFETYEDANLIKIHPISRNEINLAVEGLAMENYVQRYENNRDVRLERGIPPKIIKKINEQEKIYNDYNEKIIKLGNQYDIAISKIHQRFKPDKVRL